MTSGSVPRSRWLVTAPLLVGAALVIAGCTLPWMTLFAGLKQYSGLIGLNGRVLLGAGVACGALGVMHARHASRALALVAALLGTGIIAFTAWILVGLMQMVHGGLNAMSIARPGPGLFVILAGGLLMLAPAALERRPAR